MMKKHLSSLAIIFFGVIFVVNELSAQSTKLLIVEDNC